MRRTIIPQIVLIFLVTLVLVGFLREWWVLTTYREGETNKVDLNLTLDPDKMNADADRVQEQAAEAGRAIREEASRLSEQIHR